MQSIYKSRAYTGFSKDLWMCQTWCLTSVGPLMYLRLSVFLNLCTIRLLNLIQSRLQSWLEWIWDLDHKTQTVEPCSNCRAHLAAWDVGRWDRNMGAVRSWLLWRACRGTRRELGPVLPESKSTVLRDLFIDTTYVGWEMTLHRLGVQKGA